MTQSFAGNANGRIGSNGLGSAFGHSQPIRVDSTTSINSDDDGPQNAVSRELRTAAGKYFRTLLVGSRETILHP